MKVPLSWLKEYVDITVSPADLANKLAMAGFEAEGIEVIGDKWESVVIGRITAVGPHPNADRLRLVTVDLGTSQETVVCGAPNLKLDDKVAFAHVGAELIDGHSGQRDRLGPAKIRGVESRGMVCSEKELGISDEHLGIMVLPGEAPVGTPLADYLGDVIFDLSITPNRPDCLSVTGIAREVSALTGQGFRPGEVSYEEAGLPVGEQISVEIVAPELCPRYCASLIHGVKVAESPPWLKQRLLACGLRPISNIVDVTNYVMLEYGQPLHSFDYDEVKGRKIIVRRAGDGEVIVSLDGVERVLSRDMLVIADEERAVAIAGVMGGANSEVTGGTTSILLEAASFNPASIHYTGGTLRLPSEACMRFERGIRPELALPALRRATQLIAQLAGGEAAKGIIDEYPGKKEREPVLLLSSEVKRVSGIDFSLDEIVGVLTSLGFDCRPGDSGVWVTAPYWRSDISLPVDLIEEVARIIGYDKIPTTMLSGPLPRHNPSPVPNLAREVRHSLVGFGLQELITYSLTSLERLNKLFPEPHPLEPEPLRMANPMTAEQEYLRPNLRANLLAAFAANRRHEDGSIRLFELGLVYLPRSGDLPDEREFVCGVSGGPRLGTSWHGESGLIDFYDAKGLVESLLGDLGVAASFEEAGDETLHPARQVAIVIEGERLGVVGEVHPRVLAAFDISEPVSLFEIDLRVLLPLTLGHKMFQPIPRYPAVVRDIALIVDAVVAHQRIVTAVKSFPLVHEVTVFDVYTGEPVPRGKRSLAYRITFQSPHHTLTDKEVDKLERQILDRLSRELGATLRV